MKAVAVFIALISGFNASLYANEYQDALKEATALRDEAALLIAGFDAAALPNYDANLEQQTTIPTQQGELEQKGQAFIESHEEAQEVARVATENRQKTLTPDEKDKARSDLNTSLQEEVTCADGTCLPVQDDVSDSLTEGAVQLGALNGVATEVNDTQAGNGIPALFRGHNLTCRVVYRTNRVNFCNKDQDIFSASQAEKALRKARLEGRAVSTSPNTYCSKRIGRACREKRQSWCVFPSKLARILQVEVRRQLRLNFGEVGGHTNRADCRGLTPDEMAAINFDSPEMKAALEELSAEFQSKLTLPDPNAASSRIIDDANAQKGSHDD